MSCKKVYSWLLTDTLYGVGFSPRFTSGRSVDMLSKTAMNGNKEGHKEEGKKVSDLPTDSNRKWTPAALTSPPQRVNVGQLFQQLAVTPVGLVQRNYFGGDDDGTLLFLERVAAHDSGVHLQNDEDMV